MEKWSKQLMSNVEKYTKEETNWFLKLLTRKDRRRIIVDPVNRKPYMYRYFVLFKDRPASSDPTYNPWFNIFLHNIVQSDPRHLHDHPWWYITIILKGGYFEITPKGKKWMKPGTIKIAKASSFHRLEIPTGNTDCWTLFFRFRRIRTWGFVVNNKWVDHDTYFAREDYLYD